MTNIPIYRAKKIDSDELVECPLNRDLFRRDEIGLTSIGYDSKWTTIDLSSLSIHFPNMLDKNGKKVFASFSDDGVGGDIVTCINGSTWTVSIDSIHEIEARTGSIEWNEIEVVGNIYENPDLLGLEMYDTLMGENSYLTEYEKTKTQLGKGCARSD